MEQPSKSNPAAGPDSAKDSGRDPATTIAFQGIAGAYSHLACREAYPDMTVQACDSFDDAFAAVQNGAARLAMIPIENSLGGRVADIHHLLPESNLYIIAEHYQPVHHQLMAPKGARLEALTEVHSHPQALAQCREQVRHLGVKPVSCADTAGAARDVAARGDPTIAALSSSLAAATYGLEVLRSRFEDRIGNTTRFVVMSRSRTDPDPQAGPCMVALFFQLRSVPAALYKSLGGFATNGVNITKLESYITDASFTVAQFYAEIEGHPAQLPVARALEELEYFTSTNRILGTFPAAPFRRE